MNQVQIFFHFSRCVAAPVCKYVWVVGPAYPCDYYQPVMSILEASELPGVSVTSRLMELKAAMRRSGVSDKEPLSLKRLQPADLHSSYYLSILRKAFHCILQPGRLSPQSFRFILEVFFCGWDQFLHTKLGRHFIFNHFFVHGVISCQS